MSSFLGAGGGGGGGSGLTVGTTTITGGTSGDLLFDNAGVLGERLGPFQPAGANLNFYVATTGSNSNPGTITQPFATLQHALNIASLYDYESQFSPTIHIADGTYNVGPIGVSAPPIELPALFNPTNPGGFVVGNTGTPQNVVFWDQGGFGPILQATGGPLSNWDIGGITWDEEFFVILIGQGSILQFGDVGLGANVITDRTGNTFQSLINLNGDGGLLLVNFSLTFAVTNLGQLIFTNVGGPTWIFWNAAIVFQAGSTWGAGSSIDSDVFLQQQTTTFFNPAAGGGLNMAAWCSFFVRATANYFIFGNGGITADPSCTFENNNAFGGWFAIQDTGPPTTTDLPITGIGSLQKDTANGPITIGYRDGNTVQVRQLGRFVNTQTASYTLQLFDQDGRVEYNAVGAGTITVPTNASVAFPVGTEIQVTQVGAGALTVAAAGGVTGRNFGTLAAQWSSALLYKRATNEWVMTL